MTRATHWISASQPDVAQAIASIVLNFGAYEQALARLLEDLEDCPPNGRTSPKRSVDEILKAIRTCSERAFEASPLGVRLAALTDIADGLNRRRNILVHGRMLETTEGGFVTLVEKPALCTVYSVGLDDLIKLDDDLTRAQIHLDALMTGVADPSVPETAGAWLLNSILRRALAPVEPRVRRPISKATFPKR